MEAVKPGIVTGMVTIISLPLILIVPSDAFWVGLGTGLAVGLGFRMAQVYRIVIAFRPSERGREARAP